jgi:hypothetical protein
MNRLAVVDADQQGMRMGVYNLQPLLVDQTGRRTPVGIALTLEQYLNDQNVDYDVVTHERTNSSLRTAHASHVPGDHLDMRWTVSSMIASSSRPTSIWKPEIIIA